MAARLDKIQVSGFKSIRQAIVALGPLTVCIGANGAGKTNFISLFRLLNAIVEGRLREFVTRSGGADALLFLGSKETQEIKLDLEFGNNLYSARLAPTPDDNLFFIEENCYFWDRAYPRPYHGPSRSGHEESLLTKSEDRIAKYIRSAIENWQLYHFHDTSANARVKKQSYIHDNIKLASDAANLAPFLLLLRDAYAASYAHIVRSIQLVAPFFDDFVLRPIAGTDNIQLAWQQKGSDKLFGPSDLSDGTLRYICLATVLLQPVPPATILIDEPELGLHPYAIVMLASMLRSASTRMQVIVSTQSVPLVNQFSADDLLIMERNGAETETKRLSSETLAQWIDDFGLGDLWEKNLLGGQPTHA